MDYSCYNSNLGYFNYKINTFNPSTVNTEYNLLEKENPNIFSPIHTNNLDDINILELSSLRNNKKLSCGVSVKKINPVLSTEFYSNLNLNTNSNKKTLVLDLDETLVHSSTESPFPNRKNIVLNLKIKNLDYKIYAIVRPYLDFFLKEMSHYFNLYIFTASMSQYSKALLDIIDKNKLIIKIFSREHCKYKYGIYFKDLSIFNVDYKDIIIIDNNPTSYALNKSNGIPIQTWIDDPNDKELIKLIPLLKYLANVDDVRPIIKKIVNKTESSVDYSLFNKLLKNNVQENINIDNNISLNSKIYQTNSGTLHQKSKAKLKLNNKIYINLPSANNDNYYYITKSADEFKENKKEIKIIKNYVKTEKISTDNKMKTEYPYKKIKTNKLIKEKIPKDKIKQKEVKNQPDIYNISIGNITNIHNNIKIILKDKNKIIISKKNKPESIGIKKSKSKSKFDNLKTNNLNNKKHAEKFSLDFIETKYNTVNNINLENSVENKHQTKYSNISQDITLTKPYNKRPLDKDEYFKKIPNDRNIFYFPSNNKTKNNIIPKETQNKTNIIFNDTYRNNNYLTLKNSFQPKKKILVMKIIKNTTKKNRNNIIKNKINKEIEYKNNITLPKKMIRFNKY